jgi:hypothetical protein
MDDSGLHKEVFVYFLGSVKSKIYKSILDGNNSMLQVFGNETPNPDTPLWMITGGEAINYYSSMEDKTPTKDIDCKLLFTGVYNIPKAFFDSNNFPKDILHLRGTIKKNYPEILTPQGFNFQSAQLYSLNEYFVNFINNAWNVYWNKFGTLSMISGLTSRQNILWNCMTGLSSSPISGHLIYISNNSNNDFTHINFNQINEHVKQSGDEWTKFNMDLKDGYGIRLIKFKVYLVKTPYLDVGNLEDSFPYNMGDYKQIKEISDNDLFILQQKLDAFYNSGNQMEIWNLYYKILSLMNMRRYLMSLNGVCILVSENGQKWAMQEGILDLFIDFSASESKEGKKMYENKLNTGMIPNILKKINYCGKIGYLRIPTLNWLIYDQTRMLYHSLRLQEVSHTGWSDKGVDINGWKEFADGKQKKYFSKLKGLLNTYLNAITQIEDNYKVNKETIVKNLQSCNSETECMPSSFLSYIYGEIYPTKFINENDEINLCRDKSGGKKGKKKSKKGKTIVKKGKTIVKKGKTNKKRTYKNG